MYPIQFVEIREEHLPAVLEIYTYYVLHSTATFHIHVLSLEEMRELVFFDDPRYRAYVLVLDTEIIGYVILSQHKKREAYYLAADVGIYLKQEYTGKGIGIQVLKFIEEVARQQKIHVIVSSICGQNTESIRLFEKHGYEKCAHFKEVGYKFGQFLDVIDYQKILD